MAGAYAAATRLVSVESLVVAAAAALPTYRSQHRILNEKAIWAGAAAAPAVVLAAWPSPMAHK
jgi:hypothetical protein